MSSEENDELGFANPSFRLKSTINSPLADDIDSSGQHFGSREQPNGIDTQYVQNEVLCESDAARFKNRSRYAQIESADMGVPNSPDGLSSPDLPASDYSISEEIISTTKHDRFHKETFTTTYFPLEDPSDFERFSSVFNKNNKTAQTSQTSQARCSASSDVRRLPENYRGSTHSLVEEGTSDRSLDEVVTNTRLNRLRGISVESLADSSPTPRQHNMATDMRDYAQQYSTSNDVDHNMVDYSHNQFKSSLQAIEQASRRGGSFSPGGAIRVRKEGDTTIVSEHRDPYSFYWGLDQVRPQREEPLRSALIQEENLVDEMIADDSALQVESPDSHDSGIQVEYVRPSKTVKKMTQQFEEQSALSPPRKLPNGWERHEDPRGFSYYWHVDSGTITREPPPAQEPPIFHESPPITVDRLVQVDQPVITERQVQLPPQQPVIVERAFKQTTTKRRVEKDTSDNRDDITGGTNGKPIRFAVRSLGCTEIAEADLAQDAARAVNRAIVQLSTGRNDIIDNVMRWGDGKEIILELDDRDLRLVDPDSGAVLHFQPIQNIRVWGIGRENGRDFAYVARDKTTRRFNCHVFRCDTPARTIAKTLQEICNRVMSERRPQSLSTGAATTTLRSDTHASFPTPMEEPKKVVRCHFLGVTQVPKATGVDILNEAVDRLVSQVRQERWILVDVAISPSTITITEVGGNPITECRIRYLSFLGIGRDIKHCAFIMHQSDATFKCFVFHVEPSAGPMAKTIEAACKLRFQKALDADRATTGHNGNRAWGDRIKDAFGSLTGRQTLK